jgi:hypothetical protein
MSARTLCNTPGNLEADRTSLNRLGTRKNGSRLSRLRLSLRLAALRATACTDSKLDLVEPVSPAHAWKPGERKMVLLQEARVGFVRPFSGYRLSRWSTVEYALSGHPLQRCGRLRSGELRSGIRYIGPHFMRIPAVSGRLRKPTLPRKTRVLKRTQTSTLVCAQVCLSDGCACASAPTDTESATAKPGIP